MSMMARAKLNLALHVTGQCADGTPHAGYHTLHSLVAFADFGDEVRVQRSSADKLTVEGPFSVGVPALEQNTLGNALKMVRRWGHDDLAMAPVAISLTKDLPVASGIGGGSADAAALIALLTKNRTLSATEASDVLALGADVPMCLAGCSAIISGIGEKIAPVDLPSCALVLVNPRVGVETPSVFRALAEKTNPPLQDWSAPKNIADLVRYLHMSRNDLMAPAIGLVPEIAQCLAALASAPFSRMSGSGATCFALCETMNDAEKLAAKTQDAHPDWWVCAGKLSC